MSIEADVLLGTDLAGYRIESVLGRGGMGVVYLATDLRLKRRVALKLVAPELAADPRFRERFLREAELAASLDHSHIVPVYAAGELDARLWIAMRYVQGTDLKTLLEQEGPLEPTRALALVRQVGEALDTAHVHGLVHRDVKPANVLVTQEGGEEHCYLADFGLARSPSEDQVVAAAHLSGTVDYTAPEQIAREPLDQRADVYSLGCVLYECLAGDPPFRRPTMTATIFAQLEEEPPSLRQQRPELPEAIDGVIAKALAKDPEERHQTCGELTEAARQALGIGRPRFTRRQLVLAGAGAAVAVAAVAAVPAILLTRREGEAAVPEPILPLAGDSVVRIDPATGALIAAVGVSSGSGPLASGEGSLWLGDLQQRAISRIDPGASAITEEIDTTEASAPNLLIAGEGALWFKNDDLLSSSSVWKYDVGSARFTGIDTEEVVPDGLATTVGALWVACDTFLRIDTKTGEIASRIDPGTQGDLVAAGEDAVWFGGTQENVVAAGGGGRVWRVDPSTSAIVGTIDFDTVIADLAAGEGAVWVLGLDDDLVRRIDPATNEVSEAFRVGRIPESLGVGNGAVWVTSSRDGTVTRFDLATANLTTIDVGGAAHEIAVGEDAVWVGVNAA